MGDVGSQYFVCDVEHLMKLMYFLINLLVRRDHNGTNNCFLLQIILVEPAHPITGIPRLSTHPPFTETLLPQHPSPYISITS